MNIHIRNPSKWVSIGCGICGKNNCKEGKLSSTIADNRGLSIQQCKDKGFFCTNALTKIQEAAPDAAYMDRGWNSDVTPMLLYSGSQKMPRIRPTVGRMLAPHYVAKKR